MHEVFKSSSGMRLCTPKGIYFSETAELSVNNYCSANAVQISPFFYIGGIEKGRIVINLVNTAEIQLLNSIFKQKVMYVLGGDIIM